MDMTVRVPGSCGELVQGWMDGEPFLVTCPIEMYTTVHVSDCIEGLHGLGRKSLRALELTLEFLGKESFPWGMELTSELPQGKGMASSSADIAAVAAATGLAFGRALTPQEILALAVRIEPTDGVFFPSVVRMNQVTGTILEAYPKMPRFWIAVFDTGGTVDTVALHQRQSSWLCYPQGASKGHSWKEQFSFLRHDEEAIGRAATQSAVWHNDVLPKTQLLPFIESAKNAGALGVCAAHSGTVLGALFSSEQTRLEVETAVATIRTEVPALAFLYLTRMRSGGIDIS